jgi:hypothetical protein
MASCKFSFFASVFLHFLHNFTFIEAQVIVDFTLAITALGFQESTQVISFKLLILLLETLPERF